MGLLLVIISLKLLIMQSYLVSSGTFLILVVSLFQKFTVTEAQNLRVFSKPFNKGINDTINASKCSNLPRNLEKNVSGISTDDFCVRLYEMKDCQGGSLEILPNSPVHYYLNDWNFENKAVSVGPCRDRCDLAVIGNISNEPVRIQIFGEAHHASASHDMELKGCTLIPPGFIKFTRSIKTHGQCVQIYNNVNCSVSRQGFDYNSIELRADTPFHEKLIEWEFPVMAAISHCAYKCNLQMESISNQSKNKPKLDVSDSDISSSRLTYITVSVSTIFIVLSVVGIAHAIKRCKPRKRHRDFLTEREIQEFRNGLGLEIVCNAGGVVRNENDYSVEILAENRPYNDAYEVSRSRIRYDSKIPVGMGQFGVVYKGMVNLMSCGKQSRNTKNAESLPVAIKTVRPGAGAQYLRSLLKEVKVMLYVGKHDHVAFLVGCCSENLQKGEFLVLMEYCANGSLISYLLKNRDSFKNFVFKGRLNLKEVKDACVMIEKESGEYLDLKMLDYFQLLQWCTEIALGMEFLANSKVIHSDLAARNVLLTDNLTAKISDFGLSRQLYAYSKYVKKNQEPLPWRWMALESLKKLEFSSKSDVWSYGVLVWEIFTLGETPYPGMVWSVSIMSNLEDGLRLDKPKNATTECYNLMLRCWEEDPILRPGFTGIIEQLEEIGTSHKKTTKVSE